MEQHVDHTTAGPSQPGSGKPPRHDRVRPRSAWAVWSMLAVSVVSLVFAPILAVANGIFQQDAATQLLLYLTFGAFMVVGALIVTHRPGNAIGWLFPAIALLAFPAQLAGQYAIYASVTRPGSLPGAGLGAWYGTWPWWLVTVLTLGFTPLLFPTGRLAGRGGPGGLDGAGLLPDPPGGSPGPGGRQPDRGGCGREPRGEPGRPCPDHPAIGRRAPGAG